MLKKTHKFIYAIVNRTIVRNLILLTAMGGALIFLRGVNGQAGYITWLSDIPKTVIANAPAHAEIWGMANCEGAYSSTIYANVDVVFICSNGNPTWSAAHTNGQIGGSTISGDGESYELTHGRQVYAGGILKACFLPQVGPWTREWPERCAFGADPGYDGGGGGHSGDFGGGTPDGGMTYYYQICTQVCSTVCDPDPYSNECIPGTQDVECALADCRIECFGDC